MDPLDELREATGSVGAAPPALESYLALVRERAYAITDGDVAALLDSGIEQDELFEQTVAAAAAEGFRRLDAGLEALGCG